MLDHKGVRHTVLKLAENLEIDTNELLTKESDKTVWATIDTEADPWVVIDVEVNDD